jgi:hypothetical protein
MNIKINIGEIITRAWKITWKFKVLWIFGILAGCGGGNGSRYNFNNSGSNLDNESNPFSQFTGDLSSERMIEDFLSKSQEFISGYTAIIVGVILLVCVLWIVFYFVGVMGKTGLIKGTDRAENGAETLSFGTLWTESLPYFWRMFGLNMLVGLPFVIFVLAILAAGLGLAGFSSFTGETPNTGSFAIIAGMLAIFVPLMCIIGLLAIVVGMVVEQAQNAIVLEDLGILAGLNRGWNVFKSAILTIIILAIIIGVISAVVGFVVAVPVILAAGMAVFGVVPSGGESLFLPVLIFGACFVLYLPVLLTLSGILTAFSQSVWTLTYKRLTAPATPSPTA